MSVTRRQILCGIGGLATTTAGVAWLRCGCIEGGRSFDSDRLSLLCTKSSPVPGVAGGGVRIGFNAFGSGASQLALNIARRTLDADTNHIGHSMILDETVRSSDILINLVDLETPGWEEWVEQVAHCCGENSAPNAFWAVLPSRDGRRCTLDARLPDGRHHIVCQPNAAELALAIADVFQLLVTPGPVGIDLADFRNTAAAFRHVAFMHGSGDVQDVAVSWARGCRLFGIAAATAMISVNDAHPTIGGYTDTVVAFSNTLPSRCSTVVGYAGGVVGAKNPTLSGAIFSGA